MLVRTRLWNYITIRWGGQIDKTNRFLGWQAETAIGIEQ